MSHRAFSSLVVVGAALSMGLIGGCRAPSKVNIELRKQNQNLQAEIGELQRRHDADQAEIRGLQASATTVPSLPESELNQLYTVAGLRFGRLTGGDRPDLNIPGDTMLKVYIVPIDQQGDQLKAAGSFQVKLFDLALKSNNLLGTWNFDLEQAKSHWVSGGFIFGYVLPCPWQIPPVHSRLLARVTYTDALTHRILTAQKDVTVQPPPATRP